MDDYENGCHYLYYWPWESISLVGHVALKLNDGTYISHWPKMKKENFLVNAGQTIFKKSARQQDSLADDIVAEKQRQPIILKIPALMLDTTKIKKWLSTQAPRRFNLFSRNCAHFAAEAILMGCPEDKIYEVHKKLDWHLLKKPVQIYEALKRLVCFYIWWPHLRSHEMLNCWIDGEVLLKSLLKKYVICMRSLFYPRSSHNLLANRNVFEELMEAHLTVKQQTLEQLEQLQLEEVSKYKRVILWHISRWFTYFTIDAQLLKEDASSRESGLSIFLHKIWKNPERLPSSYLDAVFLIAVIIGFVAHHIGVAALLGPQIATALRALEGGNDTGDGGELELDVQIYPERQVEMIEPILLGQLIHEFEHNILTKWGIAGTLDDE